MQSDQSIVEQAIRDTLKEYLKKSKVKKKDIYVLLNMTLQEINGFLQKNKPLQEENQKRIFEIMGLNFKKEVQKKADLLACRKMTKKTVRNFNPSDFTSDELKTIARLINILRSSRKNDRKIVLRLIDTVYYINQKSRVSD